MVAVRRYRVINPRFDTRGRILGKVIEPAWDEHVQQHWAAIQTQVRAMVGAEFGEGDLDQKVGRLIELDAEPFSLVAYHNTFLRECRYAYVQGSYFPALTGAGALGERVLNHLMLALRDDFKSSPHYKKLYDKESFDNWDFVIDVLYDWDVFDDRAAAAFSDLKTRRNAAVHFNPATDHNARDLAREAILSLQHAVEVQFGIGAQRWFIPKAPHPYVRADAEDWPFVKRVILVSPSVALVGPKATLEFDHETEAFAVAAMGDAGDDIGSDEEFLALAT